MKHKNMQYYKLIFKLLKDFFRLRFLLKYVQTKFYKYYTNITCIIEKEKEKKWKGVSLKTFSARKQFEFTKNFILIF